MSNLIQNPGFEILVGPNDFADWLEVGTVVDNTTNPYTGTHAAQLGTLVPLSLGTLSQTFSGLVVGKLYTLSFYSAALTVLGILDVSILSLLNVVMLSTTISVNVLSGLNGYTQYTFQFTAWDTTAVLTFANVGATVILLDDVSVALDVVCYSGKTLVYARDNITGVVDYIKASEILSDRHSVLSTKTQEFIPVIYNIVSGPSKRMRVIKKDALGPNMPIHDLVITSGHTLIHDNKLIKVRDLPQSRRYKLKNPINLYSICVNENQPILVAGLEVTAWGHQEWLDRLATSNVTWHDNKLDDVSSSI